MHTRPWEEAVPAVLVVMTVGPEMSPNLLNLLLSLTVSLRSLKKAFQTWNTNCGPQSETTSYGMPKGLWKRASAVSRAVGTP